MITDKQLYVWIVNQRAIHNRGKIELRRSLLLEKIPGWTWNILDSQWEEGFIQLQKHGVVKKEFKNKDGYNLGDWISRQRSSCKDPERRKRLESIPGWTWNAFDSKWEEGFTQLQKYGMVERKFKTKEGYRLGQWVGVQVEKCKDPERRKRLESIPGWTWTRLESQWEEGFMRLEEHGSVPPVQFKNKDGYRLGDWCFKQRQRCKDPERRKRLESIPGWYWKMSHADAQAIAAVSRKNKNSYK